MTVNLVHLDEDQVKELVGALAGIQNALTTQTKALIQIKDAIERGNRQ